MCRVDYCDEMVELQSEVIRKARKEHVCNECLQPIKTGQHYEYCTYLFEGRWTQHKTCMPCITVRGWLQRECNGWIWGQVIEEVEEHWKDYNWDAKRTNEELSKSFLGTLLLLTKARTLCTNTTQSPPK